MSDQRNASAQDHALSFGAVAEVYDRARPSYPAEAVDWLVGTRNATVLELGAGTGKLTELLVAGGHRVIATDPLPEMLTLLKARVPGVHTVAATAEAVPLPSRCIDVIVCAQSFHWFDHDLALAEMARVLRPGGYLALVWNTRDEGIPWVKKLGSIIGGADRGDLTPLTDPATRSEFFGPVESRDFRFWQHLRRDELADLVRSRSYISVLPEHEQEDVLAKVGALYDDYGRGPDGMRLPYLTQCHRVMVTNQPPPPVVMSRVADEALSLIDGPEHTGELERGSTKATVRTQVHGREDTGTLLIDFS